MVAHAWWRVGVLRRCSMRLTSSQNVWAPRVQKPLSEFVGTQAAIHVHKFHPMIGVLLISTLSERVDQYILGFYHNTVSNHTCLASLIVQLFQGATYTLHNFDITAQDIMSDGRGFPCTPMQSSLAPGDPCCAWRPWGFTAKGLVWLALSAMRRQAIRHTSDNDTDDGFELEDYDGIEPPYPTYQWDRFMAEEGRKQMLREHAEVVVLWVARITLGI
jgi:hypothetical protein